MREIFQLGRPRVAGAVPSSGPIPQRCSPCRTPVCGRLPTSTPLRLNPARDRPHCEHARDDFTTGPSTGPLCTARIFRGRRSYADGLDGVCSVVASRHTVRDGPLARRDLGQRLRDFFTNPLGSPFWWGFASRRVNFLRHRIGGQPVTDSPTIHFSSQGAAMDHKWLEDFVALAQERSFSKAAELRHVTQPQFSRRIRALELWAGADLVSRACVPLVLTAAGEELLPVLRRATSSLNDVRARIRHSQSGMNWITLATGRTLSRTAVPPWLARVKKETGEFRLKVITGSIHEGATALEQGAADFLLTFTHPRLALLLDEQLFEGIPMGTDELVAVSAPRSDGAPLYALPGNTRTPVPVLGYAPTLALHQILEDSLSRGGRELHLQVVTESDFAEFLHEQALRGAGLAWLPRGLVDTDLRLGRLVEADPARLAVRFEIRMYHPKNPRNALVQRIWTASSAS